MILATLQEGKEVIIVCYGKYEPLINSYLEGLEESFGVDRSKVRIRGCNAFPGEENRTLDLLTVVCEEEMKSGTDGNGYLNISALPMRQSSTGWVAWSPQEFPQFGDPASVEAKVKGLQGSGVTMYVPTGSSAKENMWGPDFFRQEAFLRALSCQGVVCGQQSTIAHFGQAVGVPQILATQFSQNMPEVGSGSAMDAERITLLALTNDFSPPPYVRVDNRDAGIGVKPPPDSLRHYVVAQLLAHASTVDSRKSSQQSPSPHSTFDRMKRIK
jgi:hypothetical protein